LCKLSCCKLCQKERVALLRHTLTDRPSIINDWSEIHGSCCHWARFHQLTIQSSNDDPNQGERVVICCFQESGQATGCGLGPTSGCRVPALDLGPRKRLNKWPHQVTTGGEGLCCNSSSTNLYRFFMILVL
jgi:hypothetical protein